MTVDRGFIQRNLASTERIRALAERLTDEEMQHPVGEHWTVAVALAHLAFWDRRVLYVLDMTERAGVVFIPEIDIFVNDLSLPLWAAIPPREGRGDRHRICRSAGRATRRLPAGFAGTGVRRQQALGRALAAPQRASR